VENNLEQSINQQSPIQQSSKEIPSMESKWKLKKGYWYSLLFAIPSFFMFFMIFSYACMYTSGLIIVLGGVPRAWLIYPAYTLIGLSLFILWIKLIKVGFNLGKKLEVDQALNKKSKLISVSMSMLLILDVVIVGMVIIYYVVFPIILRQGKSIVQDQQKFIPTIAQSSPTLTPDPTANWKIYANKKYNYSLMCPQDTIYKENEMTANLQEAETTFIINEINLKISGNKGGTGYTAIKTQGIVIDGIKTLKLYASDNSGVIKAITSPKGDEIYFSFTLPADQMRTMESDKLLDQILSTFKFTN
jgi:hypothetical protein